MLPNVEAMAACSKIRTALVQALDRRGIDGEARVPWYFPTPGDYATRLERAGFRVDSIALIPRPTPLPGDVIDWLETFAQSFLQGLPAVARAEYLQEVRAVLEPQLRDSTGTWVADYVRLRFAATKVDAADFPWSFRESHSEDLSPEICCACRPRFAVPVLIYDLPMKLIAAFAVLVLATASTAAAQQRAAAAAARQR